MSLAGRPQIGEIRFGPGRAIRRRSLSGSRPSTAEDACAAETPVRAWARRRNGLNLTASQPLSGGSWGWGAKEAARVAWGINSIPLTRRADLRHRRSEPAKEIGRLQSDFLHDHAADRDSQIGQLAQAQRLDEGDGVGGVLSNRGWDLAGAAGDARAVDAQDQLTGSESNSRPSSRGSQIVHGADVCLIENEPALLRSCRSGR